MNNITSANASISISSVAGNADFEKFSADSALTADTVEIVETRIGVDGQISAGYLPTIKHFTVDFEASSNTIKYLMNLWTICETTKTPQAVVITITIPSVGKKFICSGFLKQVPPMYTLKKTLDPVQFGFDVATPVVLNIQ